MRKMMNSGVRWIGEIPVSWNVIATKYLFQILSGATPDSSKPECWDGEINWITPADYKTSDVYVDAGRRCLSQIGFDSCSTSMIPAGNIVFSKRAPIGSVAINRTDLCTNQGCLSCVSKGNGFVKYYYYVMSVATEHYELLGSGTTFKEISATNFANFILPYPDYQTQGVISNYLDSKCARVDSLIANVQAQIEKLKTYKQSLITEVVTKGLDPTVSMKDAGVEWFDQINASYSMRTIRSMFKIKKDIIGREPETVFSITQRGLRVKNINENEGQMASSYAHYQIVNVGDFAMNHMDLLTGGIGIAEIEGVTSPDYRVFVKKNQDICSKYFLYVFETYYRNKIFYAFGQGAANMGRWRLPAQNFNTILIPVPSIDEQYKVAEYLDKKCAQIDYLIDIKQAKIEKLEQYKRSFIYEYVTGKKSVLE